MVAWLTQKPPRSVSGRAPGSSDLNNAIQTRCFTGMENSEDSGDQGDQGDQLKSHYAQNLAAGVDLPRWAAKLFGPVELAVLGAIRDAAYKAPTGACSLTSARSLN